MQPATSASDALTFEQHGAQLFAGAALAILSTLQAALAGLPQERAGLRLRALRACGTFTCTARAGDVWLYATPILHASQAALRPARRRVLQLDYAARDLPDGLEWLGV